MRGKEKERREEGKGDKVDGIILILFCVRQLQAHGVQSTKKDVKDVMTREVKKISFFFVVLLFF